MPITNIEIDEGIISRLYEELTMFNEHKMRPKPLKELFGKPKSSGLNEFCKKNYKNYFGTKE